MSGWLRILEALRAGQFPNYYFGFTPRFIIGASQNPIGKKFETKDLALEATKHMVEEMRRFHKDGLVVVSSICDIHHGPVMALSECAWSEKAISHSFQEIWNRYGEEIVDGNYQIDANELKILKRIFGE